MCPHPHSQIISKKTLSERTPSHLGVLHILRHRRLPCRRRLRLLLLLLLRLLHCVLLLHMILLGYPHTLLLPIRHRPVTCAIRPLLLRLLLLLSGHRLLLLRSRLRLGLCLRLKLPLSHLLEEL